LFDSSNYEEEEDEDYSVKEDIIKNFKRYKNDDELMKKKQIVVPKSEVNALLAD
jgi:hypothetical protein